MPLGNLFAHAETANWIESGAKERRTAHFLSIWLAVPPSPYAVYGQSRIFLPSPSPIFVRVCVCLCVLFILPTCGRLPDHAPVALQLKHKKYRLVFLSVSPLVSCLA